MGTVGYIDVGPKSKVGHWPGKAAFLRGKGLEVVDRFGLVKQKMRMGPERVTPGKLLDLHRLR